MIKFITFEMQDKRNHFSVTDTEIKEKKVKIGGNMSKCDYMIITQKLIDNLQAVFNGNLEEVKEND